VTCLVTGTAAQYVSIRFCTLGTMTVIVHGTVVVTGTISQQVTWRKCVSGTHTVSVHVRISVTISGTQTFCVTYCWPQDAAAAGAAVAHPQSPAEAIPPSETPKTIVRTVANPVNLILISSLEMGPNQAGPGNPIRKTRQS
jgi:hypothetical protein